MRILYVCPYYKPAYIYGGPTQCFSSACEGLVESGAQVTVLTTNANGPSTLDVPLQQPINIDGVDVWYFPVALHGLSFFYSPSLADAVRVQVPKFDLVVNSALWGHAALPASKACSSARVPYVIPAHGQLFPWALAKKRLKKKIYLEMIGRRCLNKAAAIHCTDPSEANAVANLSLRVPVFIVPNAIRASVFSNFQARGFLRMQFGIPDNAQILLFLGRITQIKRPDIALDVLAVVQSLGREVHLVIAGPDEDGMIPKLRAQAQELVCHNKLHFTGLLEKEGVIGALADADLLLMPSEITENFGLSAVEAMAAGVPILVSDGVPVGHWAMKAGAGRVVPCTKEAFQQAAIELLSQPDELKELGKMGQELVKQRFDVSVVTQQMLMQYKAIISSGKPLLESRFNVN